MSKKIRITVFVLSAAVFVFSAYKLVSVYSEYQKGEALYDSVANKAVNTAFAENTNVNAPPITVDFDALLAENPDVVGWIYCEDTPINYPIVQSDDNDYYLHRMLDGNYSSVGTPFMDYRSNEDYSDLNTIIYGHNMKNSSMFGVLPEYSEQDYYDKHSQMWLFTPEHTYKIELLAGFVTSADSEIYQLLETEDELSQYITESIEQSTFKSKYSADADRVITLSTCSYEYEDARYVLVGKIGETDELQNR